MAHWRTMMQSDTLNAGHLFKRGDVVVTIESVTPGKVKVQGGKRDLPHIKFKEFPVPLASVPTNSTAIVRMYNSDTDGWIGKRVTLYVDMVSAPDPLDKKRSIMTEAIRIRPVIPATPASSVKVEHPPLTEEQEADVQAVCEAIDKAASPAEVEEVAAKHRDVIKAIGGRALVLAASAKTQRLATIAAQAQGAA